MTTLPEQRQAAKTRLLRTLFLLAVAASFFLQPRAGVAQQEQAQPAASSQPTGGSFISPKTANDQNIPKAEEEDETAVYKTSASVRAIGRLFHLSPQASSSVFEYFNFLILAGAIVYYLARAIPKAFKGRQKQIDQQLVEARTKTVEANERLSVVEGRLARLDQEIEQLRLRTEQDGAADEERIKQAIEEERKKIVASAEEEIAMASAVAERNLRRFAAELTLDRVKGRMALSEEQDRALVRDFASGLHERRN